ncbi:RHS repeat domain-containing protein [Dysgonomonas sp.]
MSIKKTTSYNSKGQVSQVQSQTGNLTTTENYTYDVQGRIASSSNSAGQSTSYTYGNRKVTTVSSERTYTKTSDAWGNIKTIINPGTITAYTPASSLAYTYYSSGKPKSVVADGATFSMTYDVAGNQATLTDPNAGTISYTYDAAGRLTKQIDGNGKITTNIYNALGRLGTKTVDGVATTYTYGTSGYELLQLTKVQTGNNYIAYTHDKYGRILTEKRQVEGNSGTLDYTYAYNAQGQLGATTYPDGLQVNRQYDAYGNPVKILAGTQAIWELIGKTGQVTTTQLGGTLTTTRTHNAQGLLTNLKTVKGTAVLRDMNYVFDGTTGNLTSRSGMLPAAETFVYDNMDRLTSVKQGATSTMKMTYLENGNISTKTGLGIYGYGTKPHAVTSVENTGNLSSSETQAITYTAFNKAASISQKAGADNLLLNFTYGPDQQRWKTELKKNNVSQKTIIFAGDYEAITENGVTMHMYYINGGDGLAAVYVKQPGQTDKIYYTHTDHLGSIIKITDGNGSTIFNTTYDAWGNRSVSTSFVFHRGYTGHEHLKEFGLIDMNGRIYDPVLGRFLSPDPYVQSPLFSQNYNRYSYCLNNPLKYTDPSGEFLWIPVLIAAIQYGYMNGAWEKVNEGNFFNGFWKGALVGGAGAALGGIAPLGTQVIGSTVWGAVVGTSVAAGGVWASGSNNYSKIWIGGAIGAAGGFLSSEQFVNYSKGKGFINNDKVLYNYKRGFYDNEWISSDKWYQDALDYFGFEGKYNPNAQAPDYIGSNDYYGFTDWQGRINFGNSAFSSYDDLKATYIKELFHSNRIKSGIPFATQDIPGRKVYPEERLGFIHSYKNKGLYPKSSIDAMSNISYYQLGIEDMDMSEYYLPKWWHFIYKIPRRW